MPSSQEFLEQIAARFYEVINGEQGDYVERICAEYSRPATLEGLRHIGHRLRPEGVALREILQRIGGIEFLARLCRVELSACRLENDTDSGRSSGRLAIVEVTFDIDPDTGGGDVASALLCLFAILQSETQSGTFSGSPFYGSGVPDIYEP